MNNKTDFKYNFSEFTLQNMFECGLALRQMGNNSNSMEEVSNKIIRYLYNSFIDSQTQEKSCVLVRFFKTHSYQDLEKNLQQLVSKNLPDSSIHKKLKCLTLLATVGDQKSWNNRLDSQQHQVIPLLSSEDIKKIPMIAQLVHQFGLDSDLILTRTPDLILELEQKNYNVFYIQEALSNPYIPDQESFVIPFGIKSVLGFGGMLPCGNLFAVIMFSKTTIPKDTAQMFNSLALNVKAAILNFIDNVFDPINTGKIDSEKLPPTIDILQSKITTLTQLLEVSEKSALKQSRHLEKTILDYDTTLINLRKTQKKLIESEKNALLRKQESDAANKAKTEFLRNMSHEIRTPMNAILGFSDLLKEYISDPLGLSFLDDIIMSGRILLNLINDILDLSKIETGKLQLYYEEFNLHELIEQISKIFTIQARQKNLKLQIKINSNVPEIILFDETRLRQILFNLVANAIKFTHEGYVIMRVKCIENISTKNGLKEKTSTLKIDVEDTGIGILPKNQEIIFDTFTQGDGNANRKYEGTGLGLTISKNLTKMLGGEISVESEFEKGSIFTLTFPNIKVIQD